MKPDLYHDVKPPQFSWRGNRGRGRECVFQDLSMNLPLEASLEGMSLTFELPMGGDDPVYLKNKCGEVLFEWPGAPSLTEVREVAQRFLGQIE